MINSLDIDECILNATAQVERWAKEFEDGFYRKQRRAAIGAWWGNVPEPMKQAVKLSDPDLYKRMEEGDYGTKQS